MLYIPVFEVTFEQAPTPATYFVFHSRFSKVPLASRPELHGHVRLF